MKKSEEKKLILRYAELVIKSSLLQKKLSPDEEEELKSIPDKLGMSHREILIKWAKLTTH